MGRGPTLGCLRREAFRWIGSSGGRRALVGGRGAVADAPVLEPPQALSGALDGRGFGCRVGQRPVRKGDSMGMRSVERSSRGGPRRRLVPRKAATLAAAGLALLLATAVALAATGDITQPAGTAGCVSQAGVESCADGHALNDANGVAVSPDGKNVYVASYGSEAVARLHHHTTTSAIPHHTAAAGCRTNEDAPGPSGDPPTTAASYE